MFLKCKYLFTLLLLYVYDMYLKRFHHCWFLLLLVWMVMRVRLLFFKRGFCLFFFALFYLPICFWGVRLNVITRLILFFFVFGSYEQRWREWHRGRCGGSCGGSFIVCVVIFGGWCGAHACWRDAFARRFDGGSPAASTASSAEVGGDGFGG